MPTINEMIDFCEDFASYDCFDNEQFKRREMFYAIADELKKSLREQNRPHGEWIIRRNKQGAHIYSVCSKCNVPYLDTDFPNFCPNCGSDNRKKRKKRR